MAICVVMCVNIARFNELYPYTTPPPGLWQVAFKPAVYLMPQYRDSRYRNMMTNRYRNIDSRYIDNRYRIIDRLYDDNRYRIIDRLYDDNRYRIIDQPVPEYW